MEKKNEVRDRSYSFALRIFKLCRFLEKDRSARIIANQLLKSGTSIGANVEEALGGQTRKDFIAKMSIALKEARETNYWLRILHYSETIPTERISNIIDESEQIIKILAKIIISSKESMK